MILLYVVLRLISSLSLSLKVKVTKLRNLKKLSNSTVSGKKPPENSIISKITEPSILKCTFHYTVDTFYINKKTNGFLSGVRKEY